MPAVAPAAGFAELEAWLVDVCTDPGGVAAGVGRTGWAAAVGVSDAADVSAVVTAGPHLSALERLAIYGDGYAARLVACLLDDYPALAHALGTDEFERLARAYVAAHPSRSPSLNAYGAQMAVFVAGRSESWAPFATDLARLEWALVEVVHARAPAALEPADLARIAPEDWARARLVPSPALRILEFSYPVNAFYQAFCADEDPQPPAPGSSAVAVQRSGLSLFRLELTPAMHCLLGALTRGETLGAALLQLEQVLAAEALASAQAELFSWFQAWIQAGFFTALELA